MASLSALSCKPWSYFHVKYSVTLNPEGVGQIWRTFCILERASAFTRDQTWAGKNGAVTVEMNHRACSHLLLHPN